MLACAEGFKELAKLLITEGADLDLSLKERVCSFVEAERWHTLLGQCAVDVLCLYLCVCYVILDIFLISFKQSILSVLIHRGMRRPC